MLERIDTASEERTQRASSVIFEVVHEELEDFEALAEERHALVLIAVDHELHQELQHLIFVQEPAQTGLLDEDVVFGLERDDDVEQFSQTLAEGFVVHGAVERVCLVNDLSKQRPA